MVLALDTVDIVYIATPVATHLEITLQTLAAGKHVRASFGTPFRARGRILTPAQGGSILLDRGIYPITLAHWFLGDATEIAATEISSKRSMSEVTRASISATASHSSPGRVSTSSTCRQP